MIRRLARCIREYKWAAMLSPLCMVGEVAMEVTIPLVMADLYDYGVCMQDMNIVITRAIQLVLCAIASLLFGVASATLYTSTTTSALAMSFLRVSSVLAVAAIVRVSGPSGGKSPEAKAACPPHANVASRHAAIKQPIRLLLNSRTRSPFITVPR